MLYYIAQLFQANLDASRYQARQLYDVVADVGSYPRFIPFCTGTRIMAEKRQGDSPTSQISMDAEMTVGFLSLSESYVSKVTCTPFTSVEVCGPINCCYTVFIQHALCIGCCIFIYATIQDTLDDMAFSTSTSEQAYGWPKYAPNLSDP